MQQQAKGTSEQSTTITRCKIHPAIGIARVGDGGEDLLPDRRGPAYPVYPRASSTRTAPDGSAPGGPFPRLRLQRPHGEVVRELTDEEAEIRSTVHLANRKAAACDSRAPPNPPNSAIRRCMIARVSSSIRENAPSSGRNSSGTAQFDTGAFAGDKVDLGDLRADAFGRLVVLGGHGLAGSSTVPRSPPSPTTTAGSTRPRTARSGRSVTMRDTAAALVADPRG